MSFTKDPQTGFGSEQPEHPQAFGITFTPQVIGISIAVVGMGIAGYLWLNFVQAAWQNYNTLKQQRSDLEGQTLPSRQEELQAQLEEVEAELAAAIERQNQVLALMSSQATSQTILIDLERLVEDNFGGENEIVFSQEPLGLMSFSPVNLDPEVVNDGSLGGAVNGRVKRLSFDLQIRGTFDEIQGLIRDIEQLQPLLIVRDFETSLDDRATSATVRNGRLEAVASPRLSTRFTLDAILPNEAASTSANPPTDAAAE